MGSVIIGISGGIAVFKTAQLVSNLVKKGIDVEVIMTKNATEFVTPLTFSSLTKHDTYVDTFNKVVHYDISHISLAKKASLFVLVPATANLIAKVANGLADDMLTTTFLACDCKKIICPAMNTNMYENPITVDNLKKCEAYGIEIIDASSGRLACGDIGKGKLADISLIEDAILAHMHKEKPLKNKRALVSAGPTIEAIDPVRYITNHSSGKMGYSLAKALRNLGAEVTLVTGQTNLEKPYGMEIIEVLSAKEMKEAIISKKDIQDYIFMAAAVADYRPAIISDNKIKKSDDDLSIKLERTDDILKLLGENKTYKLCGFAMETENLIKNAKDKLIKKNLDLIVANNIKVDGAGFKNDTNVVTLISPKEVVELELMSKDEAAYKIIEKLLEN